MVLFIKMPVYRNFCQRRGLKRCIRNNFGLRRLNLFHFRLETLAHVLDLDFELIKIIMILSID